jgi:hypothetical protein
MFYPVRALRLSALRCVRWRRGVERMGDGRGRAWRYRRACLAKPSLLPHIATRRLVANGLVSLALPSTVSLASRYRLAYQTSTLPQYPTVRECLSLARHDVFRGRNGLPRTAAELWELLCEPMTAAELADRTGRSLRTVKRNLDRMARIVDPKTGEVFSMVECDGDLWRAWRYRRAGAAQDNNEEG